MKAYCFLLLLMLLVSCSTKKNGEEIRNVVDALPDTVYYWCPIKLLITNKIRADSICRIQPFMVI